jgi:hypothetical protein
MRADVAEAYGSTGASSTGIVERERRVVGAIDDDEEDFVREMTGHGKPEKRYGLDAHGRAHLLRLPVAPQAQEAQELPRRALRLKSGRRCSNSR